MHDDFHYYCTRVLARAAGFSDEDSHVLAYASQYVDDAKEHKPIVVGNHIFDPVRTAYLGLRSYSWSVNKRIFIPFHFLPPQPIRSQADTFITEPDSEFSHMVIQHALQEKDRAFRLVRLGIALHTYADTFAHQGFSGRRHRENDVTNIQAVGTELGDVFWKKPFFKNIFFDFAPRVGHAEAGMYPDLGYLHWKYTRRYTREVVERDNTEIFFESAHKSYKILKKQKSFVTQKAIPWREIKKNILKCIAYNNRNEIKRIAKWKHTFKHMFKDDYHYDRYEWRKEAFYMKNAPRIEKLKIKHDIRTLEKLDNPQFPMKKEFYHTHWVLFHRAALKQRHFVLEHLF